MRRISVLTHADQSCKGCGNFEKSKIDLHFEGGKKNEDKKKTKRVINRAAVLEDPEKTFSQASKSSGK